jgi:GT2 family glycosyltransferase
MQTISVLMTTHNRLGNTRACLESLFTQTLVRIDQLKLLVTVVDSGSTDGTLEMLRAEFPSVRVVAVDPHVYWARGMRRAQAEAGATADYELWLNDDVLLDPDAIERSLRVANQCTLDANIVVGATREPGVVGETSYGGYMVRSGFRPLSLTAISPKEHSVQKIDTFNGNFALISRQARIALGEISPVFVHSLADIDYGLRAKALGILAPGHIGECPLNRKSKFNADAISRLRNVMEPKQFPPKAWLTLCVRHGGPAWALSFMSPYICALSPSTSIQGTQTWSKDPTASGRLVR